jgi:diguanylate cyclase (GGDEF)-like protein
MTPPGESPRAENENVLREEGLAPADLLDSIVQLAAELLNGQKVSLLVRQEGGDDFVIAKALGLADEVIAEALVKIGQPVAGSVAASQRSILIQGLPADHPALGRYSGSRRRYRTDSFVSVPIVVGTDTRAVLNVADHSEGRAFTERDLLELELLARHTAACIAKESSERELRRLAETDALTGLFNRRHFDKRLAAEISRAQRSRDEVSLLVLDVDRFKEINDRQGHAVGDLALQAVARGILASLRGYDLAARIGGDEFAAILPETSTESARMVAQRISETVMQSEPAGGGDGPRVSVSIGVATYPAPARLDAELVEMADRAMYLAKQDPSNRVRVWTQ